jgi:DNA-binding SARP family transcriptional activator
MLKLQVLGPLALWRDGAQVPLTVRRGAALLVLLALQGPTPRQQAATLLWPDLDEAAARRNLRRELVRLREAGAGEVLQAERDTLALHGDVEVDALHFEQALQAGEPESALALWRGAVASDLSLNDSTAFDDWLASARQRWHSRWSAAVEAGAAAAESSGHLDDALSRLEQLLADDPLQERHWRSSMRLLNALGRRDEALVRFQRCRELLHSELGLAPMADTQALADSLAGPAAAPATLPRHPATAAVRPSRMSVRVPDVLPFVGREAEIGTLEQAWQRHAVIVLEGEGGIGKTRLAVDFAAAHGPYALVRCQAGDAALPLAGFARSLRALAGPEPDTGHWPDWVRREVARLLPELGPAPPPLRHEDERLRLSQACAHAWQAWGQGSFDAMLIDDWHLADASSQTLWAQMDSQALRLVLTCRPPSGPEAAARLKALVDAGAAHLRIPPLATDAVLDLVRQLSGASNPQRFATLLAQASGGLPFHIGALLRHLADAGQLQATADGAWHTAYDDQTRDYRELPLPARVVDTLVLRARSLPEPAPRVLEAAALAASPFGAALLAPACALSEVEAELAFDAAQRAGLLREHEDGGQAFTHDLVQQALESALEPARRRSIHRRLALGAAAAGAAPARVAAHFEAGGEPQRAVPWRQRAMEQALPLMALDEAIAHGRQALADGAAGDDRLAVGRVLVRTLELRGLDEEADALAQDLLRVSSGSAAARVEARIAVAGYFARRDRASQALELLEGLPSTLPDEQRESMALVRSNAMRDLGRIEESRQVILAALERHPAMDARRVELLDCWTITENAAGRHDEALRAAQQSLDLSRRLADARGEAMALKRMSVMLMHGGQPAEAETQLKAAAAAFERLGMVGQQRGALFNLCVLHASQTRPEQVLRAAQMAWDLKPPQDLHPLRVHLQLAFVEAHIGLGQLGPAWHWLQGAVRDAQALGSLDVTTATLITGAELMVLLDRRQDIDSLLTRIDPAALSELQLMASEFWVTMTEWALVAGDLEAARRSWQYTLPAEQVPIEYVRARHAVVLAAMHLAEGRTADALPALPAPDLPPLGDRPQAARGAAVLTP